MGAGFERADNRHRLRSIECFKNTPADLRVREPATGGTGPHPTQRDSFPARLGQSRGGLLCARAAENAEMSIRVSQSLSMSRRFGRGAVDPGDQRSNGAEGFDRLPDCYVELTPFRVIAVEDPGSRAKLLLISGQYRDRVPAIGQDLAEAGQHAGATDDHHMWGCHCRIHGCHRAEYPVCQIGSSGAIAPGSGGQKGAGRPQNADAGVGTGVAICDLAVPSAAKSEVH